MSDKLALVFDIGTQSTRAFLFDTMGNVVAKYKYDTIPYHSPKLGFAEKDIDDYWKAIVGASQGLKKIAGDKFDKVIAMSVTSLRCTYAFLDENYKPTRPVITWLDQRLASKEQKFSFVKTKLFQLVGMYRTALKQRRMSPATWMKENQPDIWKKTKYTCLISAYINYKLCGRLCDSTASQASRLPYNYRKETWQSPREFTYTVFNFDREKLVELVKPGDVIGKLSKEASEEMGVPCGLEIIASGSDKGCETLGVGALKPDIASISFGTTASLQITTKHYVEPEKYMPAYNSVIQGRFNPEIQIFRGFWMVTWFKNEFGLAEQLKADELGVSPETVLNMKIQNIPPGSDGLMLQPYWAPGLKIPEAKGTIVGFNDCHTKAHFYRAIIEGINYALYEALKNLEKRSGQTIKKISVSGGGSQSDIICQITADMFGLPVYRVQTFETSGLGAAMIVFVAKGVFKDYDDCAKNMIHFKDEFKPDKKAHEIYQKLFDGVYKEIYGKLQPLYIKLYDIVNKE